MANVRLIKRRIKSAKNISQITKAMELVAASKMKKAQAQAQAGKLYAQKIYEMVTSLAAKLNITYHPLLSKPKRITGKRLVILITTNKGLCGGLNNNLFRYLIGQYQSLAQNQYLTLGRKGADFLSRSGASIAADFSETLPFINTVPAVIQLITRTYLSGAIDGVDIVFNEFISALSQQTKKKTILPLTIEPGSAQEKTTEFLIEPSAQEVFELLLPHYLENQLRDAVLQADASEHSARMVAMRNATDNATALITELTLIYNKARQEKITYEITDMVTSRLAVEV